MNKSFIISFFLSILIHNIYAQNCSIRGAVVDSLTNTKVEYANISLKSLSDSSFVTGGITNTKGIFEISDLEISTYELEVSFIGYQIRKFKINLHKGENNLGTLKLSATAENLDAVTISASQSSIIYKVDRKVINAESFPEASSGIELLENVPSVQVSIDGRSLKYRGDGVFKVYINGKPVKNGVERLREIPAKQIDKIEVITNPSAKYSAEGTAGIINVLLKKSRLQGYAINSSINADTKGAYEFLFSINKNGKKGGWYANGQYANYIWGYGSEAIYQKVNDLDFARINEMETQNTSGAKMNFMDIGFNYDLSKKDEIDFSFTINPFNCTNEDKSKTNVNEKVFINEVLQSEIDYKLNNNRYLAYKYYGPSLSYKHKFNKTGSQFLLFDIDYSAYIKPLTEKSIDSKIYADTTIKQGYYNTEQNEQDIDLSIDYENPIGENYKFETGVNIETNHILKSTFENGYFDSEDNILPFKNDFMNQEVFFIRDVYSAYFSFKGRIKKFDYQLGLRTEHTIKTSNYNFADTNNVKTELPYNDSFTDLFPSFHTTYSLSEDHQIAMSYSKRISRPQYYDLMPIRQYNDPFSYTIGNASLKPTYINALELNYKKSWEKDFFSAELFSRFTNNVTEYYTRVDTNGLMYMKAENVGKSQSIGSEIMGTYNFSPWWVSNLSVSLYSYQLFVAVADKKYNKSQLNSDVKFNNTFRLPKSIKLKLNFSYYSPSISAQAKTSDYFISKIAISKSFFKDHWSLLLYTNNIFGSIKWDTVDKSESYYIKSENTSFQYFGFSITYNFNNQE